MSADGILALVIEIAAGLCLAACCGLRAFLPPFLLGLAARVHLAETLLGRPLLSPSFSWLASTPALIVFGAAVIFEVLADKIPALDHLLDLVQTVVRPLAGALVVAAALHPVSPLWAAIVGVLAGAPLAGAVHLGKAKIRLLSTLGTGGLASPILSFVEDAAVVICVALALVVSLVAFLLVLAGVLVTWRLVRGFLRRVGRLRQDLGSP